MRLIPPELLCCVLETKTLYPLHSTDSNKEDRKLSQYDLKIVDWDVSINSNTEVNKFDLVIACAYPENFVRVAGSNFENFFFQLIREGGSKYNVPI